MHKRRAFLGPNHRHSVDKGGNLKLGWPEILCLANPNTQNLVPGTPVWLRMATLGQVSGRIVAEVLVELLRHDTTSFLSQTNWEPDFWKIRQRIWNCGLAHICSPVLKTDRPQFTLKQAFR
jgi:hypothetical protein